MLLFQKFNLSQLLGAAKDTFKINWKPICSMMEDGINVDQCQSLLMQEFIDITYELGTKILKRELHAFGMDQKINVTFRKLAHEISMRNAQ